MQPQPHGINVTVTGPDSEQVSLEPVSSWAQAGSPSDFSSFSPRSAAWSAKPASPVLSPNASAWAAKPASPAQVLSPNAAAWSAQPVSLDTAAWPAQPTSPIAAARVVPSSAAWSAQPASPDTSTWSAQPVQPTPAGAGTATATAPWASESASPNATAWSAQATGAQPAEVQPEQHLGEQQAGRWSAEPASPEAWSVQGGCAQETEPLGRWSAEPASPSAPAWAAQPTPAPLDLLDDTRAGDAEVPLLCQAAPSPVASAGRPSSVPASPSAAAPAADHVGNAASRFDDAILEALAALPSEALVSVLQRLAPRRPAEFSRALESAPQPAPPRGGGRVDGSGA